MMHQSQSNRRIKWFLAIASDMSLFALLPSVVESPLAVFQQTYPNPTPVLVKTVETHGLETTPVAQRAVKSVHVELTPQQYVVVLDRWNFGVHLAETSWRPYLGWYGMTKYRDETNELWRFISCLHDSDPATPLTVKRDTGDIVGIFRININKYFWMIDWYNPYEIEQNMQLGYLIWQLDGWSAWPKECAQIIEGTDSSVPIEWFKND